MRTLITESPQTAAAFIRRGQLAAFPTETVYGLGADALNHEAVEKIYDVKGRPPDNPLIVHLESVDTIAPLVSEMTAAASKLVEAFFPGSLTLVLRKSDRVPDVVTAGLDTVGIRVPSHPIARAFLQACARPVAAPSANKSGSPSPTTWQAVMEDLGDLIPCVLQGGRSAVGLESTVVDCTLEPPQLLRQGVISIEDLCRVTPVEVGLGEPGLDLRRSPGLRHRHYAPRARVELVDPASLEPEPDSAFIGLQAPADGSGFAAIRVCATVDEYAYELFQFFRECDRRGIATIYCGRPPEEGIGRALVDRIERAGRR